MTNLRIQNRNEIGLNGHVFRINGRVLRRPVNELAEKVVIGPFTEDSDPVLSNIVWKDWRGGQGRFIADVRKPEHFTEYWFADVHNNEFEGHLFPLHRQLRQAFNIASSNSTASEASPVGLAPYRYSVFPSDLYVAATDGASSFVLARLGTGTGDLFFYRATLASEPLEVKSGYVSGTRVLAIAESTTFQLTRQTESDTALITSSGAGENIRHIEFWRDLMWGLNSSGDLYFVSDISGASNGLTWTHVSTTESLSTVAVTGLHRGEIAIPGSDDREHLFISRNDGFDIYDRLTERLVPALRVAGQENAGQDLLVWQGSVYYPYGMSLLQWTPSAEGNIVKDVGLSLRDGMPDSYDGHIYSVAASGKNLFVTVNDDASSRKTAMYTRTNHSGWTKFAEPDDSTITADWPIYVGLSKDADLNTESLHIFPGWTGSSNSINVGVGSSLGTVEFYPLQLTGGPKHNYGTSSNLFGNSGTQTVIGPWLDKSPNQDWTALKLEIEVGRLGAESSHIGTFHLDYGLDRDDDSWTTGISVTDHRTEGHFEARLPNDGNPVGIPFDSIRWRARWVTTNPIAAWDLNRIALTFRARPKLRYAFSFEIDFSEEVQGYSPKQQREFLDEFFMQATLGEFNYHDDFPGGGKPYYVTPLQPVASEETGTQESGVIRMTVMEAV